MKDDKHFNVMKIALVAGSDYRLHVTNVLHKLGYVFVGDPAVYVNAAAYFAYDNGIIMKTDDMEYFKGHPNEEYVLIGDRLVKVSEYFVTPATKVDTSHPMYMWDNMQDAKAGLLEKIYAPLPPDGTQALIAKQKAIADKILDKLFLIDPFAICAGGAPRDWHFGKPAADIDIFFHTRVDQLTIVEEMLKRVGIKTDGVRCAENLPEWYKLNPALKCVYECTVEGVSVQLMLMNDITHRTVVPNFPFSICKVWYKNGTIHRENIFDHCERHKVVVKTSEIYNDEHKYVQKIKGKFPDYQFFDTWEQAYKYVFEKDCK